MVGWRGEARIENEKVIEKWENRRDLVLSYVFGWDVFDWDLVGWKCGEWKIHLFG